MAVLLGFGQVVCMLCMCWHLLLEIGRSIFFCEGCLTFQWPCGIIIKIVEMFNCESKSQVYGHLHNLLMDGNMSEVGKWLIGLFFIDRYILLNSVFTGYYLICRYNLL